MIGELFLLAYDLFYGIVILLLLAIVCSGISIFIVDFPCTIIETIIKKEIPENITSKIKVAVTIILVLYVSNKLSIRDIL